MCEGVCLSVKTKQKTAKGTGVGYIERCGRTYGWGGEMCGSSLLEMVSTLATPCNGVLC